MLKTLDTIGKNLTVKLNSDTIKRKETFYEKTVYSNDFVIAYVVAIRL